MLVFFALGNANFFAFYPTRNLKVALYPMQNPDASQWNIGCVGSQRKILALAMYISLFFVSISFELGPFFSGIWA